MKNAVHVLGWLFLALLAWPLITLVAAIASMVAP